MIATLSDRMKQYQSRLLNPAKAPNHGLSNSGVAAAQPSGQPMPGMVVDPVLSQSAAEERFFAEQIASGYQLMQSGMVETAADEANLRLFQEHSRLFGLPEPLNPFTQDPMQPGYPQLQQQAGDAPEPMPHPALVGLGGW